MLLLHGAPYAIAPKPKLHVHMTLCISPAFVAGDRLDPACLRDAAKRPASHDHLFSTVLGVFDVRTSVYRPERDLLGGCRAR